MIDKNIFKKAMAIKDDSSVMADSQRPTFLYNCQLDDKGIRAVQNGDGLDSSMTNTEQEQLKEFSQNIMLDFPCSIAEFIAWVKRNGLAEIVEWSELDDQYLTLKNIAKINAKRPRPTPPLQDILSTHIKPNDAHIETLTVLYRGMYRLQEKINSYDNNIRSDISIIEAKKAELQKKVEEINSVVETPLKAMSQASEPLRIANVKSPKSQAKVGRRNALHDLIKRIDEYLSERYKRRPKADQVWNELKNNHNQHDEEEIIQEVTKDLVFWVSMYGSEPTLKRSSFPATLSRLRRKKLLQN